MLPASTTSIPGDTAGDLLAPALSPLQAYAWRVYLVVGLLALIGFFLMPSPSAAGLWFSGSALLTVFVLVAGVRLHRPAGSMVWYLLALGMVVSVIGDAIMMAYIGLHGVAPFPSVADFFYGASYVAFIAAVQRLTRLRAGASDRGSIVDALIVSAGVGLVAWVFLIDPIADNVALPWLERLVSMAYPLMDLLMLAVLVRLWFAGGTRPFAYILLSCSCTLLLLTDTALVINVLVGATATSQPMYAAFMLCRLLLGLAALHPSVRDVCALEPLEPPSITWQRLTLLAGAALLAPATLGVQAVRGAPIDAWVFVVASALLFLLVLARMSGLVRMLGHAARRHERAVERERALRTAAEALVVTTSVQEIYATALEAVRLLIPDRRQNIRLLVTDTATAPAMGAAREVAAPDQPVLRTRELPGPVAGALTTQRVVEARHGDFPSLWKLLDLDASMEALLLLPLRYQESLHALIVVASAAPLEVEMRVGVEALGAQLALTLDRVALAKDLNARQSEARFRALVQNASEMITIVDANATIQYVTPSVQPLLGYTPEALIGCDALFLLEQGDRPAQRLRLDEMIRTSGMSDMIPARLRHLDGRAVDIETRATNLLDDPNVRGLVFTSRDVTEHKRAEQALRQSEERLRVLFEHCPDGIFLIDPHHPSGRWLIVECNDFAATMNGYARADLIGQPIGLLDDVKVEPEDNQTFLDRLRATYPSPIKGEVEHRRKDGTIYPVEFAAALVTLAGRELLLGIDRDVTERHQLAQEQQRTAALQRAAQAAEEASRLKSDFLATMSHEIRTPMNGVIGMTEMLLGTSLDADQREYTAIVRDSAYGLLTIINDILDFSKIEAGMLQLDVGNFSPRALVEGAAEVLLVKARQQQITLLPFVAPDMPPLLQGDAGRLRQVLLNLVGNAVKFSEGGEVVVRATVAEHTPTDVHVHFAVSDTGIGLSPAAQSRLFHPFTQADSSMARKFGGTGLGLAISKRLVEVMGGAIGVESAEGQGSTFWFSVPLRRVIAPMPPQMNHLGQLRVLVVDTNATHREIMQRYLAAWQLRSTAVASAEEALVALEEAALADPFHVAVLDFELPGMDGRALARVVTQNPALAQTRLIMHTGLDAPIRRREAFDAGFVGYLTKPTKMSPLLDAIVSAVGKEPPSILAPALENDAAGGASPAAASKQMILLAEDNPVNQKLALLQLRKLGYQADVVSNGRDAVTAICASQYALVLMDCQMPELDGFGATAAIRAAEARRGGRRLPIVAMTANAMQGDREACLAAGMDDYIAKPVRIDELRDIIARWKCVTAEEEQVGQFL